MASRRSLRGFTLLEMLVAAFIMAIVAMLGWRGLNGVADSRDAIAQRMRAATQLQLAMQQLASDLAAASDAGAGLPAVSLAGNGDLLIVRRIPEPLGADLRAWRAGTQIQAGALQVVRWGVRGGALLRWGGAAQSAAGPLRQAMGQAAGQGLPMLDGVRAMSVLVFRYAGLGLLRQSGAWVNPSTAADGQQPGDNPQLAQLRTPAGLRLTLQLGGDQLRGSIERQFLLENRQ
ncbi:MAG: prepilin-type N-terminal cleavage/methylation domain-containing protein [Betaproteobacteria bacterium]|nr:prepilin-type N-terminal cleavage/methylation domain-containing protein [Betaproteobacteria bacterium]